MGEQHHLHRRAARVAPALLHHLLDRHAGLAHRAGDARQDPRLVEHLEAQVVAPFDVPQRRQLAPFELQRASREPGHAAPQRARDVEDVGHDAHRRRQVARAPP